MKTKNEKIMIMRFLFIFSLIFFARIVSAQVVFNEIQISPTGERFIELYNSSDSDVDVTGWYIQRKTATGSSFNSLVTSTQFKDKTIKANDYFLISRSQLEKSDIVIDTLTLTEANILRIRDSKGEDVNQVEWTTIGEGKSYQKISTNEWITATPTPRASNNTSPQGANSQQSTSGALMQSSSSLLTLSNFPVEPQIIASAGAVNRVTLAGARIVFSGKVFGLKKEPIENARIVWSFGDGGKAEGQSVSHIYHYPGEYTVVLEASSGFYSASARVRVVVSVPQLMFHTGGDSIHSFVSIENQGNDEVDLSEWKIHTQDKDFIFPQNTVLGARKTVSFASEVTGLSTPLGISVSLYFPNSTLVPLYQEKTPSPTATSSIPPEKSLEKIVSRQSVSPLVRVSGSQVSEQTASVVSTLSDPFIHSSTLSPAKEGRWWLWYLGAGALGVLAFLGFRFSRILGKDDIADEYEIIEDDEEANTEKSESSSPRDRIPF